MRRTPSASAARCKPHSVMATNTTATAAAAAAAAAPACAAAAASPAAASTRRTATAAAKPHASSSSSSSDPKPALSRFDARLTEEVRESPLGDCISLDANPFLWACATGNVAEVRRMLTLETAERDKRRRAFESKRKRGGSAPLEDFVEEETHLQQVDISGWSPVHFAAAFGHTNILELLYAAFVESIPEYLRPPTSSSPLPLSTLQSAEFLHPIFLFLNRTTGSFDTPLHVACYNCHTEAIDWLLKHGADIHARNLGDGAGGLGHTPLMCCVEAKSKNSTVTRQLGTARFLLDYIRRMELEEWGGGSDDDEGADEEERKQSDRLRAALKRQLHTPQPLRLPMYLSPEDQPALHTAAPQPDPTSAADVKPAPLNLSPPPVFAETKSEPLISSLTGTTPAATLAEHGAKELLKVEAQSFHAAAAAGSPPRSSKSALGGANGRSSATGNVNTDAQGAAACDFIASFSSINSTRGSGSTALMMASFSGNVEVVRELLLHGALVDQNLYDAAGRRIYDSALFNAIDEGHLAVARLLLQWGANRTVKNRLGETTLLTVCQSEAPVFCKDEQLRLAFLRLLCEEGVDSASSFALQSFLLNECDPLGASPFIWSVRRGCLSVVRWLIKMGCDVTKTDPNASETVIDGLVRRIAQGARIKDKTRHKRPSDSALCFMLDIFLTEPRCAQYVTGVPSEIRAYVASVMLKAQEAEKAAAAAAAVAAAAAAAAASAARKRSRATAAAASSAATPRAPSKSANKRAKQTVVSPSTPPPSKRTASVGGSGGGHRRKKPAETSPVRAPRIDKSAPVRTPSTPQAADPPRFFKGGKQHVLGAGKQHTPPDNARAASWPETTPHETTIISEDESSDDGHSSDLELPLASSLVPTGRIQGALLKLNSSSSSSSSSSAVAAAAAAHVVGGVDDSMLMGEDLSGELSHESQVDDHMLSEESSPSAQHQPLDSATEPPILPTRADEQEPLTGREVGAGVDSEPDLTQVDRLALTLPSSPLKFAPLHSSGMFKSPSPVHYGLGGSPSALDGGARLHPHVRGALNQSALHREPMMRMGSDAASPAPGHEAFFASLTSASSIQSPTAAATPRSDVGASAAATPFSSLSDCYVRVRTLLSELGLSEFLPNFLTHRYEDGMLSGLALQENEDIFKELIPLAGPRFKLRTYLRKEQAQATSSSS